MNHETKIHIKVEVKGVGVRVEEVVEGEEKGEETTTITTTIMVKILLFQSSLKVFISWSHTSFDWC